MSHLIKTIDTLPDTSTKLDTDLTPYELYHLLLSFGRDFGMKIQIDSGSKCIRCFSDLDQWKFSIFGELAVNSLIDIPRKAKLVVVIEGKG
jgi:hypothetical protein